MDPDPPPPPPSRLTSSSGLRLFLQFCSSNQGLYLVCRHPAGSQTHYRLIIAVWAVRSLSWGGGGAGINAPTPPWSSASGFCCCSGWRSPDVIRRNSAGSKSQCSGWFLLHVQAGEQTQSGFSFRLQSHNQHPRLQGGELLQETPPLHTHTHTRTHTETRTHTHTQRLRHTHTQRLSQTHTQAHTHRDSDTHTHRDRHKHTQMKCYSSQGSSLPPLCLVQVWTHHFRFPPPQPDSTRPWFLCFPLMWVVLVPGGGADRVDVFRGPNLMKLLLLSLHSHPDQTGMS